MNLSVEIVADYINNWVTGMLEATESQSVDSDKSYVLIKDWTNLKGDTVNLCVKGSDIWDSYRKHSTGKLPSWITNHPNPEDFAQRVFKYLIS